MKAGVVPYGRHPHVAGHAGLLGQVAVVDVEFDQRLRMLGHEGDREQHDRDAVPAGAADFLVGVGPDPLQRADAALVADGPIGVRQPKRGRDGARRLRDLRRIGIAAR